jgi:hypothetical protein
VPEAHRVVLDVLGRVCEAAQCADEGRVGPEAGPGPPAYVPGPSWVITVPPGWTRQASCSRRSASPAVARWVMATGGSAPSSTSRIARLSSYEMPATP